MLIVKLRQTPMKESVEKKERGEGGRGEGGVSCNFHITVEHAITFVASMFNALKLVAPII